MSDFRNQFDQAKADYQSARYPGDLAADLFARTQTRSRTFWRIGVAFAAAASVALVIGVTLMHSSKEQTGIGTSVARIPRVVKNPATTLPDDTVADAITTDSLVVPVPSPETMPDSESAFPTDLPAMPSSDSASAFPSFPTTPSVPSFDASTNTTSSEREPT